jgi:hypothetical protein
MTRHFFQFPAMAVLAVAVCVGVSPLRGETLPADEEVCGDYGTTVIFAESAAAAAKQALKEEKLVFVLHVSGNFETSAFT